MPLASLTWDARPARAGVVVLVLHGGAVEGRDPNRPWSHNVVGLVPFARSLRRIGGGIAVARLRFRFRGWNGAEASPVEDARWALAQIRADYPDVPVALVGHSMGGRTALSVADEEGVRLVVGLAPWIERGDPRPGNGVRTVLLHGDRDRITSLGRSRSTVEAMRLEGRDASLVRINGGEHTLLRRHHLWVTLVRGLVAGTFASELGFSGAPRSGPAGAVVAQVLAGVGSTDV